MTEPQVKILYENLEALIDELLKDKPSETKVRAFMLAAGLNYTTDSVQRMSLVLAEMDLLKDSCRTPRAAKSLRNEELGKS
jgi:hypothetical protein